MVGLVHVKGVAVRPLGDNGKVSLGVTCSAYGMGIPVVGQTPMRLMAVGPQKVLLQGFPLCP